MAVSVGETTPRADVNCCLGSKTGFLSESLRDKRCGTVIAMSGSTNETNTDSDPKLNHSQEA
ncbi:uncharacterized protein METZ01_LOCUS453489 [marine metagenome]|uniref:Uncharacterized protein n=1 Tax=marine metagenome TaxID=408172 RepID=A0A383A0B3_9ZZZZ